MVPWSHIKREKGPFAISQEMSSAGAGAKGGESKPRNMFVFGNIGSGKTSFLTKVAPKFLAHRVYQEPIEEWRTSGCLPRFYKDPKANASIFQFYVYTHSVSNIVTYEEPFVTDVCHLVGRRVYTQMLIEDGLITEDHRHYMDTIFETLRKMHSLDKFEDPAKMMYVYLCTPPEVCLDRIHSRGRKEEQGISEDYLSKLHSQFERFYKDSRSKGLHVVKVDGTDSFEEIYCKAEKHLSCKGEVNAVVRTSAEKKLAATATAVNSVKIGAV